MVSLDPDAIVERRRIKRRLSVWRFLAILAVVAAAVAVAYATSGAGLPFVRKAHIAAVDVDGLITGRRSRVELLEKIGKSSAAKAVIIRINSPGGTTAGSEALYQAIRELAEEKPVTAVMGTVAASGGYAIAAASDHIVARGNTITGSIGVIFQWARVQEALNSLGIEVNEVKSGPLKAEPSLFSEPSEQVRLVTAAMVRDAHEWFVQLVAERRPFDLATARRLADGRVYTGRQALDAKLIDSIGGEDAAKKWLVDTKSIDEDLDIVEWDSDDLDGLSVGGRMAVAVASVLGFDAVAGRLGLDLTAPGLRLDGLLSLWHPELQR